MAAFAGESQARNKYSYYASQKQKKMVMNKLQQFLKKLLTMKKNMQNVVQKLNGGKVPDTLTNLKDAASGETTNGQICIKNFASVAREEGFDQIAILFEQVAEIERHHEERYLKL